MSSADFSRELVVSPVVEHTQTDIFKVLSSEGDIIGVEAIMKNMRTGEVLVSRSEINGEVTMSCAHEKYHRSLLRLFSDELENILETGSVFGK